MVSGKMDSQIARLSPESWRNLSLLWRGAGWLGLLLTGFCLAQLQGLGDAEGLARLVPPVLTALLGLTFELRQPRPEGA